MKTTSSRRIFVPRISKLLAVFISVVLFTGCSAFKNRESSREEPKEVVDTSISNPEETFSTDKTGSIHATVSPFRTYQEAHEAFVQVEKTLSDGKPVSFAKLQEIGFAQKGTPQVVRNHRWILREFRADPTMGYTPPKSVRTCLQSRKHCKAYEISLTSKHSVKDNDGSMLGTAKHYAGWSHLERTQYWALKVTFIVANGNVVHAITDEASPPQYTVKTKTTSTKEKVAGGLLKAILPF